MQELAPAFQNHLQQETTMLCHCVKITRQDGNAFFLTDHDREIQVQGEIYTPESGVQITEIVRNMGLSIGGGEMSGALSSSLLEQEDLNAGLFDNATIDIWLVNWNEPEQFMHLYHGTIGEVRSDDGAFTAEIRSPTHFLDVERGRLFGALCDADLGDHRCQFQLNQAAYKGIGTLSALDNRRICTFSGLSNYEESWFSGGVLTWISGALTGRSVEVKAHRIQNQETMIELWQAMTKSPEIGDMIEITAGCNKHYETCKNKFANSINFQGFPHMPGNDFALSYPSAQDGAHNGEAIKP